MKVKEQNDKDTQNNKLIMISLSLCFLIIEQWYNYYVVKDNNICC